MKKKFSFNHLAAITATVILMFLLVFLTSNEWQIEKITQLKSLLKKPVEGIEKDFTATRTILIDPTCLILLVTKGPNLCGPHVMIATTVKDQKSNALYKYSYFEEKPEEKYFLFEVNKLKRAFPKFTTTLTSYSAVFPAAKNQKEDKAIELPRNVFSYLKEYKASRFLPCHPTMTLEEKKDRARNYNYRVDIHPRFAERITQFIDILSWFNITGFLFNGTLLGWRRECSIIPHTTDVDIAMFAAQHSEALIAALKAGTIPDFKLITIYGKKEDSYEIQVVVDKVRIDLFYVYEDLKRNISYTAGMRLEPKQQIKWIYPHLTEICAAELHGYFVHLPCDVDKFLLADYGEEWRKDHNTAYYSWDMSAKNTEDWRFLSDAEHRDMNQHFY